MSKQRRPRKPPIPSREKLIGQSGPPIEPGAFRGAVDVAGASPWL
jgi:hypothetical protein